MPKTQRFDDIDQLSPQQAAALLERLQAKTGAPPTPPKTPRRKKKNSTIKYLESEERDALFRAIDTELAAARTAKSFEREWKALRDRTLFEVAYTHGLRVSEVGMLRVQSVRLNMRRISIKRLKNGNDLDYMTMPDEEKWLKAWLRIRARRTGVHGEVLFPSRNRRPIHRRSLDDAMKHYGELAGLPLDKRHFHCLRHTCATDLLSEHDVGIEDVQDHLGQADIRSAQIYAKLKSKARLKKDEKLRTTWGRRE